MEGFANVSRRNFLRAVAASGIAAGTLGLAG
ncbi:twin-arginine translocation signal domain-containing protein, partial [Adlercreutzia sp.]